MHLDEKRDTGRLFCGYLKMMDFTLQLTPEHDKGFDIHLHETGKINLKSIEYLVRQGKKRF